MQTAFVFAFLFQSAAAFTITAGAGTRPAHVQCSRVQQPANMVLSYKLAAGAASAAVLGGAVAIKKVLDKREDPAVANARAALAGMDSLSGLSEMKLELDEGKEARVAGVWKECNVTVTHSLWLRLPALILDLPVVVALSPTAVCRPLQTSRTMGASGTTTQRAAKCSGLCRRSLSSLTRLPPRPPLPTQPAARASHRLPAWHQTNTALLHVRSVDVLVPNASPYHMNNPG